MGSPLDYPIPVLKAYFDPNVYTYSKRSARSVAKGLSTFLLQQLWILVSRLKLRLN